MKRWNRSRFLRKRRGETRRITPVSQGATTVSNDLGCVVIPSRAGWWVASLPTLQFTGAVATGAQLREWAKANHLELSFGVDPDLKFAQIEAKSAVQACLWLKRFNQDTGYRYEVETRDCDNFARRARAFPDLFNHPLVAAQAAVFGIYAEMDHPFAGITDGVHALNVVWTDRGVFVFEPQGLDLVYQRLEDWPNKSGISAVLTD